MANNYSWGSRSSTSISGDISSLLSTGMTFAVEETPEEERQRKKKYIEDIIDGDDYLLQEIVTELRNKKINQLLNVT